MTRRQRIIAYTLAGTGLFFAVAAGLFAWWARSDAALQWATGKVVTMSGGHVAIAGARGSLVGELTAERIEYKSAGIEVRLSGVAVDWRPLALIWQRASIAGLSAGTVDITLLPSPKVPAANTSAPPSLPASFALPLTVSVDRLHVGKLVVRAGASSTVLSGIEATYAGDATQHTITALGLQSDFGMLGGNLRIATARPFALGGDLEWQYGPDTARMSAKAALGGTLERIAAELQGSAGSVTINGRAVLAPGAGNWLPEIALTTRDADLATIHAALPRTALGGTLKGGTDAKGRLAATLTLDNNTAGPWTDHQLPVTSLTLRAALAGGGLQFDQLHAGLGAGGSISGSGHIAGAGTELDVALADVDLQAIHRPLRTTRLRGQLKAALSAGRQTFDAVLAERGLTLAVRGTRQGDRIELQNLSAKAGKGELVAKGELSLAAGQDFRVSATFTRFDPADYGDYPGASISGDAGATGQLEPSWLADAHFRIRESKFRGAPFEGSGAFKVSAEGMRDVTADLRVGGNRLQARGSFGQGGAIGGDGLVLSLDGRQLAQLDPRLAGKLAAHAKLGGSMQRPTLVFDANGEALAFDKQMVIATLDAHGEWKRMADRKHGKETLPAAQVEFKATARKFVAGTLRLDALSATMTGTTGSHAISLDASAPGADFAARLEGGLDVRQVWTGHVTRLTNRGDLPFALGAPAALEAGAGRAAVGEFTAGVLGGQLSLRALRWEHGRLASEGAFTGVPVTALFKLTGGGYAAGSNLTLRGAWAVNATPRLNGTLTIARESGDLALQENPTVLVGLERLEFNASFAEDAARAKLAIRSKRTGDIAAELAMVPPAGAGPFAAQSSLDGSVQLELASLKVLNDWLGTAAVVDGTARGRLTIAGTLATPRVTGALDGDRVSIELPQHGIALKDGRLRAELTEDAVLLKELAIAGRSGTLTASGTLARRQSGGESRIEWKAAALKLLDRPDQQLTVDGSGTIGMSSDKLRVRGQVKIVDGNIEFERPATNALGDDVVVVGRTALAAPGKRRQTPLDLDATIDFGERMKISGAGLRTGLQGKVRVYTSAEGALQAKGQVNAVHGTYTAFGQKLEIERGRLYFDGPPDNPGLEIVAVRKNLPVEAGVEVTGTVRVAQVKLVSTPPVPDGEKLSWLVSGRGLDNASGADLALVQSAASSLVDSKHSVGFTRRVANQVGLDDIGFRTSGSATSGNSSNSNGLDNQVLVLGKRLSNDLYLEYEYGLDMADTVLRLSYQLTRTLSVRVESGTTSAVGLFYRRSFD